MDFILPFLFFIFIFGYFAIFLNKNFEDVIPFGMIIPSLALYICSLSGILIEGAAILAVIAYSFPITYLFFNEKQKTRAKELVFSYGFHIFTFIYVVVYILNFNRGFGYYDEIQHWGAMAQEITRLNKLYTSEDSSLLVHATYPPIFSITEYFWCLLSGGYKETYLYRALQTFCLSLLIPAFIPRNKTYNITNVILASLTILLIAAAIPLAEGSFYFSIYLDAPTAIISAALFLMAATEKKFKPLYLIKFGMYSSFLILTKQASLVFVVLISLFFLLRFTAIKYKVLKRKAKTTPPAALLKIYGKYAAAAICLIILPPAIFSASWEYHIYKTNNIKQFNQSDISLKNLSNINDWQKQTINKYINALSGSTPLLQREENISSAEQAAAAILLFAVFFVNLYNKQKPQYLTLIILTAIFILPLWFINKKPALFFPELIFFLILTSAYTIVKAPESNGIPRKNIILSFAFIFLGGIIYLTAIGISYILFFGPYAGLNLWSLARYVNTYVLFCFLLISMIYVYNSKNKSDKAYVLSLMSIISLCITSIIIFSGISFKIPIKYKSITDSYAEDAKIIRRNSKDYDKIFIISQNGELMDLLAISYLTSPRKLNVNYSLGKTTSRYDVTNVDLSKNDFANIILKEQYDYIYLKKIDDYFINIYGSLFEETPKEKTIYKINKKRGKLTLQAEKSYDKF